MWRGYNHFCVRRTRTALSGAACAERRAICAPEVGVVCWPNGADMDTDVLYSEVSGLPLPGSVPA